MLWSKVVRPVEGRLARNLTRVAEDVGPHQNAVRRSLTSDTAPVASRCRPAAPDGYPPRVADALTADDARHWALLTRAAFAARRAEIDALNVFPVPDGDTGTNLYLTMDSAIDETVAAHDEAGILGTASLVQECRTLSRSILLSARGNSGVIVSQIVGGMCQVVVEADAEEIDADLLARALTRGAELARASVAHPEDGTILTVGDATALAAREAAAAGADLAGVTRAASVAAAAALARTPEQLPVLARAGVVDAGGAGLVLMVEALHRVVVGTWSEDAAAELGGGPALRRRDGWHVPPTATAGERPGSADEAYLPGDVGALGGGPAYEVMYLLRETTPDAVAELTRVLDGLGDCLLVVGGPDLWNVHVHVDDPGAAVEAGVEAGRPYRVRITHFASQVAGPGHGAAHPEGTIAVVACSAGPGIAALMTEAGARTVPSQPGQRASAGQILAAVQESGTRAVILLPNDRDTVLAAEAASAAAAEEGITVRVVPARTVVQGIAALAVFDQAHSLDDNVLAMTSAAVATRHGAVSVAVREALTWAGVCQPGDVLGIIDGDIALIGASLPEAAREVIGRLLASGGELVTLVTGADADADLLAGVQSALHHDHAEVEVVVVDGGQPSYPLLIGVE